MLTNSLKSIQPDTKDAIPFIRYAVRVDEKGNEDVVEETYTPSAPVVNFYDYMNSDYSRLQPLPEVINGEKAALLSKVINDNLD